MLKTEAIHEKSDYDWISVIHTLNHIYVYS